MTNINKILNSKCICGKGLPWIQSEIIMLDPCEHMIHIECLNKFTYCPICGHNIYKIIKKYDFKHDDRLHQKCVDIISMSNFDKMCSYDPIKVLFNIPNLIDVIVRIPFTRGKIQALNLCEDIFSMGNITLKINGLDKIKNGPKVFIANHTSHLDFLILFKVLKTGFLSSSVINDNIISKQLKNIISILVVDRGNKSTSTVNKMRKYVKKNESICLFPEGMISHPDTIIRFRTGAFNIGYPIYPVVLKYKKLSIVGSETSEFILKLASCPKEIVEVFILDPFFPPFDDHKIEMVRFSMANAGNMMVSRVSNRDIVDK